MAVVAGRAFRLSVACDLNRRSGFMRKRYIFIAVLACLAFLQNIGAQTLTFTYQGKLESAGAPASGNLDFEFALFDAAGCGKQLGPTITRSGVAVTNGIFTVTLDF